MQQGTLTIQVGGKTLTASTGDLVSLPRGVAHCFQNNGKVDAKFLVVAAPAGLEKFFEEAFYPAADCPDAAPMTCGLLADLPVRYGWVPRSGDAPLAEGLACGPGGFGVRRSVMGNAVSIPVSGLAPGTIVGHKSKYGYGARST